MILIPSEQHTAVQPLFTSLQQNLVVESVLDGHTLGRVYVNDPTNPRLAVLWTLMDTVLLAGQPDERHFPALRQLILEEMLPDARSRYIPHFTLTAGQPEWPTYFPALFPDQQLAEVPRHAFHFVQQQVKWREILPPGMRLQPLDETFLAQNELENINAPVGWVRSFWPNTAAFAQHGLGFAVVDGTKVASWALSVYAGKGAVELGVETAVSHRGQGLATVAAAACLEACAERGLTPHWQCDAENTPSLRLAARLGFVIERHYRAHRLPLFP
jgi:RimJ/RimL family protein N-acetyltransferase